MGAEQYLQPETQSAAAPNLFPLYLLLLGGAAVALTMYMSGDGAMPGITADPEHTAWLGGNRAFFDPHDPEKDVCHKCGGDGFKPNGLPCTKCKMGFVWITTGTFLTANALYVLLKKRRKKWK